MEPLTPEQVTQLEEVYDLQRTAYHHDLKGEIAAAFPLKRDALALEEEILGPEHPYVAAALDMLAIDLYHDKRYAEAEAKFRRALAIYKQLPEAVEDLASSFEWLAFVYEDQKQWRKALTHWHDALALRRRYGGGKYFEMSQSLLVYAKLLKATGRKVRARATLKRAEAMLGK